MTTQHCFILIPGSRERSQVSVRGKGRLRNKCGFIKKKRVWGEDRRRERKGGGEGVYNNVSQHVELCQDTL